MIPETVKTKQPLRDEQLASKDQQMPVEKCGNIEFVYFSWISRLMLKSFRRRLTEEDIYSYSCSSSESTEINGERFEAIWKQECHDAKRGQNASLFKTWTCLVKTRVIISTLFYMLCLCFGYLSAIYLLRKLLTFIEGPDENLSVGLFWTFLLVLAEFLRVSCFAVMYAVSTRATVRVGSALNSIIYKKLLSATSISNKRIGEVTNLFTIDCSKVMQMVHTMPLLVGSPVILVITFVYSFQLFGVYSMFGIALFVITLCTQIWLAKHISLIRKKAVTYSDQRISLISETLSSIKFVKLCASETALFAKVDDLRKLETKYFRRCQYLHCINVSLSLMVPIMATIITILAFTYFDNQLTTVQAFTLVMLNNIAAQGFRLMPVTIRDVIQAKISFERIEQILRQEEERCVSQISTLNTIDLGRAALNNVPNLDQYHNQHNSDSSTTMKNYFKVPHGQLIGIVGSVSSGKTTLLRAISGEVNLANIFACNQMHDCFNYISEREVAGKGSIAYVAQQPFLFNDTIQENIILGLPINEKKYSEVIQCCALIEDLKSLSDGDFSIVGERGLKLSGGQKQRIALSRAVYADKNIYLLDDPLSALDVNTAQFVFHNCIRQVLRSKTVIMVTSQTMFLRDMDFILFMKDGTLRASGTHSELLQQSEYSSFISSLYVLEKDSKNITASTKINQTLNMSSSKNAVANDSSAQVRRIRSASQKLESSDINKMASRNVFQAYSKSIGGKFCLISLLLPFVVFAGTTSFSHYWLSQWISKFDFDYSTRTENNNDTKLTTHEKGMIENLNYYQIIYTLSIFLLIFSALTSSFLWTLFTLKASKRLHSELLSKMLQSSMALFERTSSGKLLHLLAKDTEEVDNQLPRTMASFLNRLFVVVFNVITIVYVYPFLSLAMTVIIAVFAAVYKMFKETLKDLKRIESNLRSPVLTHICNTFHGLAIIKMFEKEKYFTQKFNMLSNKYWTAHYLHISSMRWMYIRLDLLCVFTTFIASIFAVSYKNVVGVSFAALVITLSMQMSNSLQVVVRLGCEVETRLTAVERITSFIQQAICEEVKHKQIFFGEQMTQGAIRFENVSMKYRNDYPLVLKNVTFEVKPNEKIGIIGTTAAGKSSLAAALLRLSNYISGTIRIDSVDTSEIPLQILRSKIITIIPQDVVLLSGTIRFNLDPYSQYSDHQLINALEKATLKSKVLAIPGTLDAMISERENTFSVGEKRLFYIAKALLNNSKIIVLDEATNCVDCITENIIQQTINEAFKNATVLTITHNLRSVLNCDRIFVMENGTISHVDVPDNLLKENIELTFE